jgi:hypothetical protein
MKSFRLHLIERKMNKLSMSIERVPTIQISLWDTQGKDIQMKLEKIKGVLLKDQPKAKESTTLKTKKIMQRELPTNSK